MSWQWFCLWSVSEFRCTRENLPMGWQGDVIEGLLLWSELLSKASPPFPGVDTWQLTTLRAVAMASLLTVQCLSSWPLVPSEQVPKVDTGVKLPVKQSQALAYPPLWKRKKELHHIFCKSFLQNWLGSCFYRHQFFDEQNLWCTAGVLLMVNGTLTGLQGGFTTGTKNNHLHSISYINILTFMWKAQEKRSNSQPYNLAFSCPSSVFIIPSSPFLLNSI